MYSQEQFVFILNIILHCLNYAKWQEVNNDAETNCRLVTQKFQLKNWPLLPLERIWELPSSRVLCSESRYFFTNILGQIIRPILFGFLTLIKMWPIFFPETSLRNYHDSLRNKSAILIYFTAETWNQAYNVFVSRPSPKLKM